ncbi:RnfABCDGE type electron transport complex subunit B [Thiotrichales bacterium 19S3-7]|nr:RnfABCDGE type electron transport complex subunit B [Thiotrichales bacterium 19S3-7]MCF6800856.1 RnfABCDGE type electron transport complex subunit B [Thiotrichales bacterium 19S3-11]
MKITANDIDQLLPQTQCTQCGYKDCMDYAHAISEGTLHNQCPPGGKIGIEKLSNLLKRKVLELNPNNGVEKPRSVAVIVEDLCIGCTKCIQACPVDAISGANRLMHTVIESECTGCELCVEPCPMDCIDLVTLSEDKQPQNWTSDQQEALKNHYRTRHNAKIKRLNLEEKYQRQKHIQHKTTHSAKQKVLENQQSKEDYIQQALAQFRAKKNQLKK